MNLLPLTLLFPLLGYLLLIAGRSHLPERIAAAIGVGSMVLSALVALWVGIDFATTLPAGGVHTQQLWPWLRVAGLTIDFTLHLDGLSLTMLGVVTGVGALIHLFAAWYMRGDDGYARFFAYMNLFVASMLALVLADNLLFLYLGWEGVGLCSYLLIGFYYRDAANGLAARKAFIVTRVGDTLMAIGLLLLYREFGTLHIVDLMNAVSTGWQQGNTTATLAALLLVGGAVGKSAQLPLQTWLPDAMAGPTPVSALIHAATMVTAGVYLIARTHPLFEVAPLALQWVGVIGAATLLLAGFAALVQTDIKRVLAYSTMSQIGYMFLALGVGGWHAAIFHLMIHAFFKALLFLAAGAVINACHHEQDIFRMGGLRRKLPLAYASFLVGGSALAALPFVTAGFFSKDEILWQAFAAGQHGLLIAGLVGALLTSLYTFRLIFVAFHGEQQVEAHAGHGIAHSLPLLVLLVLSTVVGALIHPPLDGVLPAGPGAGGGEGRHLLEWISGAIAVTGIALAALFWLGERRLVRALAASKVGGALAAWWRNAWGFDWLYHKLLVCPFMLVANANRRDLIDRLIGLVPLAMRRGHDLLSVTQNGKLRWYAASIAAGTVLILAALATG